MKFTITCIRALKQHVDFVGSRRKLLISTVAAILAAFPHTGKAEPAVVPTESPGPTTTPSPRPDPQQLPTVTVQRRPAQRAVQKRSTTPLRVRAPAVVTPAVPVTPVETAMGPVVGYVATMSATGTKT